MLAKYELEHFRSGRNALGILASLKADFGDLDRIKAWLRGFGMVNAGPGFNSFPLMINVCSNLIIAFYSDARGNHARSAAGMAELACDLPVKIEVEVPIAE